MSRKVMTLRLDAATRVRLEAAIADLIGSVRGGDADRSTRGAREIARTRGR